MGSLWLAATATYGVGDVVTTYYGIQQGDIHEAHPLSDAVLGEFGAPGMLVVKAAVLGAFYVGTERIVPDEWVTGVPLGLTILGTLIVLNNLHVIARSEGVM